MSNDKYSDPALASPQVPTPETMPSGIPEGFKLRHLGSGFMEGCGPLYYRSIAGGILMGFKVEARHCNPMGVCHGGMLATFCDMLLAVTSHAMEPTAKNRFLPTISLQMDYLASAPQGAWVQGQAQVLRATRSMLFLQGLVTADHSPIVRASGIFKIGAAFHFPARTPTPSSPPT